MESAKDTASLSEKALALVMRVFDTMWSSGGDQGAWHWVLMVSVLLIVFCVIVIVLFKVLGGFLENLIKAMEAYKSSGFPLWLNQNNKYGVRRRKQFSAVLDSDLAFLAKSESWNDQHFTDLEADVETEGGYYASSWDKMRRKRSYGLRRERSLISAITSSAERAMQLIGEPGSGKSVALRHLAKQFTEQGKKSNDKNAVVPLYVNLRELDNNFTGDITADDIRQFVLDNIRRGDADTTAYVKENWADYCNRGIWLFLFDSFDEIPAVLHAETGSDAVRKYSNAIRQFLEGMGECKGVLASREFKGPEALPWKKLRILSLSESKQDELIQNSFLAPQYMSMVRQHLANSDSSIGSTPLFLTLLCRYVRDEKKVPNNDHDILLRHVERLAVREYEYIQRKYKLSIDQLMVGAERLARLFAEDDTLSLAPTLDQIMARLPDNAIQGISIERLVSALVDCKIGRADIASAGQGDRRFAFAHRRYQEALFVRYLANHPEALSTNQLLGEPRWREYTVTLLQTRSIEELKLLLESASSILECRAASQIPSEHSKKLLDSVAVFYDWNDEASVPLLSLLQEGLARRLEDVPLELSSAVHKFLEPRWVNGDTWDRCQVIKFGGLLPHDILVSYLVQAFSDGTLAQRANAFRQAGFVSKLPDLAKEAVLEMLSDQVIITQDRSSQLNLEALAARLPTDMGADFVIARANSIRKKLRWVYEIVLVGQILFPVRVLSRVVKNLVGNGRLTGINLKDAFGVNRNVVPSGEFFVLPSIVIISMWITCAAQLFLLEGRETFWGLFVVSLCFTFGYCFIVLPFMVRCYGRKVGVPDVSEWVRKYLFRFDNAKFLIWVVFGLLSLFLVAWPLGFGFNWIVGFFFEYDILGVDKLTLWEPIFIGLGVLLAGFYVYASILALSRLRRRSFVAKLWGEGLADAKSYGKNDFEVLCAAKNIDELEYWLGVDVSLLSTEYLVRGFSSYVNVAFKIHRDTWPLKSEFLPSCFSGAGISSHEFKSILQLLEFRYESLVKPV